MIDNRFYQKNDPLKISQIANALAMDVVFKDGNDVLINGIAPLAEAQKNDLAFCISAKGLPIITNAGACLVTAQDIGKLPEGTIGLVCSSPRASFSQLANSIIQKRRGDNADDYAQNIESDTFIDRSAIIQSGAAVGKGTIIGANCVIGVGVSIGRNCEIGPNCVIECSLIGDNVRIGANSVIGKSGFGIVPGAEGLIDVPHFGRVIIQDNVSIGALCAIDKGVFGDTIIGLFSKIDNHCHIAHNVKVGTGVVMAAFAGISGSVEIGDYVMMGGRVGIGDHFKIGAGAKLAAGSAVLSDVPAGETYGGYPAKPRMKWLREIVKLAKLSDGK